MSEFVTFGETALQLSPPGRERLATARKAILAPDGIESSAAVAATAVGGRATWVSKLPDTPLGQGIVGQLHQHGIETSIIWADPEETRQGIVFRESGEVPRSDTAWQDREGTAAASTNPGDLPMGLIQSADAVFTGASTPVLSDGIATTTEAMLRAAHGSGVTTALDVDYRAGLASADRYREAVSTVIEHLDVLIGNEDHVRTVFEESGQARELAHTIAADHDLEVIVITRSDRGAVVLQDSPGTNVMHEQDAVETDAVDAAGQHAAFSGAFLQRLVDGADLVEALDYGVATAALARTVPGPLLTADRGEVDRVVSEALP